MKTPRLYIIFFLIPIFFISACDKTSPDAKAVKATLYDYTGLDGCSWVIKLDDGEVLEPDNLGGFDIEIKDGKKVWVKYTLAKEQISICMVGPRVDIVEIWER
ncbi:MAG: hypothetical protein GXO86_09000 [Chlorobi bacterium]|nr:hypothetical protein [Chlorobiota bacterium]